MAEKITRIPVSLYPQEYAEFVEIKQILEREQRRALSIADAMRSIIKIARQAKS